MYIADHSPHHWFVLNSAGIVIIATGVIVLNSAGIVIIATGVIVLNSTGIVIIDTGVIKNLVVIFHFICLIVARLVVIWVVTINICIVGIFLAILFPSLSMM